jgi:membrane fusion protein (multidrug efflux system)
MVLLALCLLAGAAGGTYWYLFRNEESTDDAQVEGHVVSVSSRTVGQVEKVLVEDNQVVKAGDVLVELDRRELQARLDAAAADLLSAQAAVEVASAELSLTDRTADASLRQAKGGVSQATSGVTATKARLEQAKADISAAEARFTLAKSELARSKHLFENAVISKAEIDKRQTEFDQAKAAFEQAMAQSKSARAAIASGYATVVEAKGRLAAAETGPQQVEAAMAALHVAEARVKQAEAAKRLAELNLSYATIKSPVSGVIARRNVEVGLSVSPERPLLAVVPLDDVWVVANFKEDQISAMRPGQPATVTIDTYPRQELRGRVKSLAAGTGARFALLPPDNATGNFIKVVQRIPVMIELDDLKGLICRPGMSAGVTVRVR